MLGRANLKTFIKKSELFGFLQNINNNKTLLQQFCTNKQDQLFDQRSHQQKSYYKSRLEMLSKINFSYPHFKPSITICNFLEKYQTLKQKSEKLIDIKKEQVAGRVTAIRTHGKTTFIDIRQGHIRLQIAYKTKHDLQIRRGDIIAVIGQPFITKKGQLSILAEQCNILSPCLWMLPEYESLKDNQIRYRHKYLDLITNQKSMETLISRSKIISSLRRQLLQQQYIEVETPTLSKSYGGAIAKPFKTFHNDHKMDLYLRIAPQLDLKKLIIGGVPRVFEIGKNFRNQSIDQTHNPQFTSCQLYCSYADYRQMVDFTYNLINRIAKDVNGTTIIKTSQGQIDLAQPWQQKDFMKQLQKCTNKKLPIDFQNTATHKFYSDLCEEYHVPCQEPRTISRLLDKLASHFLQNSNKPFIIKNHPKIMSPLAKPIPEDPHLTQRFQLFINGFQIVNSYTELNIPSVQKQNTPTEKDFIQALQYGLPPCAGWGMGIDRLVMLLTGNNKIQEVIAFPLMRDKNQRKQNV